MPFFLDHPESQKVIGRYRELGVEQANASLTAYIEYLGKLSTAYHDHIPIDQDALVNLVVQIVHQFLLKGKNHSLGDVEEKIKTLLYGEGEEIA